MSSDLLIPTPLSDFSLMSSSVQSMSDAWLSLCFCPSILDDWSWNTTVIR